LWTLDPLDPPLISPLISPCTLVHILLFLAGQLLSFANAAQFRAGTGTWYFRQLPWDSPVLLCSTLQTLVDSPSQLSYPLDPLYLPYHVPRTSRLTNSSRNTHSTVPVLHLHLHCTGSVCNLSTIFASFFPNSLYLFFPYLPYLPPPTLLSPALASQTAYTVLLSCTPPIDQYTSTFLSILMSQTRSTSNTPTKTFTVHHSKLSRSHLDAIIAELPVPSDISMRIHTPRGL
jgi:hypothetical protein